ncbi:MAG: ABC transporter substrate binding protein [Pseudomonadota bacterium]
MTAHFILPLLLATLVATPPLPLPSRVVVVTDADGKPQREVVSALRQAGLPVEQLLVTDTALGKRLERAGGEVWLAAGRKSAKLLAGIRGNGRDGGGIVAAREARIAAILVREHDVPPDMAAVVSDVPFEQQLSWLKIAFPGRRRVIILRNPRGGVVEDRALRIACQTVGLELELVDVSEPGEAVAALDEVIREAGSRPLLWLLPDPVVVSADTVGPLIQTAISARVPAVGFSSYFLRLGALAAVVVDFGPCALQAVELAKQAEPRREPPVSARLVVDGRMAERLGIAVGAGRGVEVLR